MDTTAPFRGRRQGSRLRLTCLGPTSKAWADHPIRIADFSRRQPTQRATPKNQSEDRAKYIVTNREVKARAQGLDVFGDKPKQSGPNELRLVKATKQGPHYETELLTNKNLYAANARYLDITRANAVGDAHGYFAGPPVATNPALKTLFSDLIEGGRAEDRLAYAADINAYRLG